MSSIDRTAPGAASAVNYDSSALLELEIDGTEYRVDAGKQGTSLCISTRPAGSWDWTFGGEARWDGSLRAKIFDRRVLDQLSVALKQALADL